MRVGFISDIHFDVNVFLLGERGIFTTINELVNEVVEYLRESKLDYLVVSGDMMNSLDTLDVVAKLNTSGVKVYYVPGNHDMWSRRGDTSKIYEEYLRDEYCLVGKEVDIGKGYTLVGMYSWYDRSLSSISVSEGEYKAARSRWGDYKYTNWGVEGDVLVERSIAKTRDILEGVTNKVILVNHFVPRKEFILHKQGNYAWNINGYFMGTDKLTSLIGDYSNIEYVTFGHTHTRYGLVELDGVKYVSSQLGYVHEWEGTNFRSNLGKSILVQELG